jgi:hypothetical protein
MAKKRHHYIPKSYLKFFCDDAGQVRVYRKDDPCKAIQLSPDNVERGGRSDSFRSTPSCLLPYVSTELVQEKGAFVVFEMVFGKRTKAELGLITGSASNRYVSSTLVGFLRYYLKPSLPACSLPVVAKLAQVLV